jgi:hypothetical protein
MRKQGLRLALGVFFTTMLTGLAADNPAVAQDGQGKYITEATVRLIKLVDSANRDGYALQTNSFSIGGGWLKQSQDTWVPLYTVPLIGGKEYRFLGAGDADTRDLDLQVLDPSGKVVAADEGTAPEAIVNYRPSDSGVYTVKLRLYASDKNQDCMSLGVVMIRK